MYRRNKKIISPFAIFSGVIFTIVTVLYFLSVSSVLIADYLNSTVCHSFRRTMASFGDLFPFSLFELILLLSPLFLGVIIFISIRIFNRGYGRARYVVNLLAFVLLLYSGHTLALRIAYNTTPIEKVMGLESVVIDKDNLSSAMINLQEEVNFFSKRVQRDENGIFESGYSFDELSSVILTSYDNFQIEHGLPSSFKSNAKPVYHGELMSYFGIIGIYTFYTGEANVNTAYPSYDKIFTVAHELSHQRGIMRENEANFVAYLITSKSDDANLRYSGALCMYEYISSALFRASKEDYYRIREGLSAEARSDINASYEVTKKYGETVIADISEFVNDLFLKSNGTEGIVSYGKVVELYMSYSSVN